MACGEITALDCEEEESSCEECNCNNIHWDSIVGNKTLEDGGYFGDLMTLGRAHIEKSKDNGELTEQDAGQVYSALMTTAIQQSINFELTEDLREREICHVAQQTEEIRIESGRKTCKAQAECALLEAQTDKTKQDKINETNETASKISLNAAQENKLACDCCNNTKMTVADVAVKEVDKLVKEADIKLKAAQEALYKRQADGFDDNALQKLYDSQLQAWSMVFADTDAEFVTDSLGNGAINATYGKLVSSLNI